MVYDIVIVVLGVGVGNGAWVCKTRKLSSISDIRYGETVYKIAKLFPSRCLVVQSAKPSQLCGLSSVWRRVELRLSGERPEFEQNLSSVWRREDSTPSTSPTNDAKQARGPWPPTIVVVVGVEGESLIHAHNTKERQESI
jgi:hypothetical protein